MDNLVTEVINNAILLAAAMSPVIMVFVNLVKKEDVDKRWLPYISIGLGIAIGLVFALALSTDYVLYGFSGFIGGATASGLFDAGKALRKGE